MATGATPPVTPPRTDLVTPTSVDTSAADKTYGEQMANYQKGWDTQQTQNNLLWSRMQMGNASNAARSGMSIGGGSYLAGQRQAGIAATNANNQATLNWLQGQSNITGAHGAQQYGAATTNANIANQSQQFNANREGAVQDRTSTAEATNLGNQTVSNLGNVEGGLKSAGVDVAGQHGATWKTGSDLATAVQNAPAGSPEQQTAMARFQAYSGKVAQAKSDYTSQMQAGKLPALGQKFSDGTINSGLDAYLKFIEKQGFFNV
jgi:hypothetical protein